MAMTEKALTGSISPVSLTGSLNASEGLKGSLNLGSGNSSKDYNALINKPKINGVELINDKSFEDLGDSVLTNFEILELMKNAGF